MEVVRLHDLDLVVVNAVLLSILLQLLVDEKVLGADVHEFCVAALEELVSDLKHDEGLASAGVHEDTLKLTGHPEYLSSDEALVVVQTVGRVRARSHLLSDGNHLIVRRCDVFVLGDRGAEQTPVDLSLDCTDLVVALDILVFSCSLFSGHPLQDLLKLPPVL